MITRTRIGLIAFICVLGVLGSLLYFLHARSAAEAVTAQAPQIPQTTQVGSFLSADHIVFRSTALGNTYGKLAVVKATDPSGIRAVTNSTCERVYATATNAVCITASRGMVGTYGVQMLDSSLEPTSSSALTGLPSRARITRDGSLLATTTFIVGHTYASSSFSTETTIRTSGGRLLDNIENFTTTVDNTRLTAVDKNFWGITFIDDDDFYVTGASGGKTWLMRGSISKRSMTSVRTDAECPSLSPDRTKVAYKVRLGNAAPGQWHIAVLNLASNTQTVLAETRSVDDQMEWFDNTHVLYSLPRSGTQATTSDIWQVPADGSGKPSVLIPEGASPAVVRR